MGWIWQWLLIQETTHQSQQMISNNNKEEWPHSTVLEDPLLVSRVLKSHKLFTRY